MPPPGPGGLPSSGGDDGLETGRVGADCGHPYFAEAPLLEEVLNQLCWNRSQVGWIREPVGSLGIDRGRAVSDNHQQTTWSKLLRRQLEQIRRVVGGHLLQEMAREHATEGCIGD